jgi:photosystem II stability/assembly factor-like uncharacterized protein
MDDQLLFDRFHAAYDIEPRTGSFELLRATLISVEVQPGRRPWLRLQLPQRGVRLLAAALLVAVALASAGAFIAINQYAHRPVPIRTHRVAASGTCFQGFHMVSPTVGWRDAVSRTTDGGATWQDVPPPTMPNFSKQAGAGCALDAEHAWTTQATGPSLVSPTELYVFATADGGQTWQQGAPVPASGVDMGVALEFIDPQNGWLLTDTGSNGSPSLTRTLYATSDGGLHWRRVVSGSRGDSSSLGQLAGGCSVSGMTFLTTDKGWLTWDCSRGGGSQPQPGGPVVAVTIDGGHTWAPLSLPSFPGSADWICGANPPLLSGNRGVLPVSCAGSGHNGWAGVYRTNDSGDSWTLGQVPVWVELTQVDFVDAATGFVFAGVATSDLYRTTDSGRDWALVKKSVFSGQGVGDFQFLDTNTGFAYTSSGGPWKTTDGGVTWSLSGQRTLPGNVGCPAPSNPGTGLGPIPILMATPTTGWAIGARRTTDGGAHWSSAALPPLPDRSAGYAEFFLDGTHAWVAEAAGSATACSDHVVVFSTADGGQTWRQSGPIPVVLAVPSAGIWRQVSASYSPTTILSLDQSHSYGLGGPWLDFVDANHGWLLIETQPIDIMGSAKVGPLYRTIDGGLHWTLVTEQPAASGVCSAAGGISFISTTTGWMPAPGCSGGSPLTYRVTHDGGVTWTDQAPGLDCGCDGTAPVFFDGKHGLLVAGDYLLVTSDGGATWSARPLTLGSLQLYALDFIDSNQGWALASGKSGDYPLSHTTDGGKTWTVVNAHLPPPSSNSDGSYRLTFIDALDGFWATGSELYKTTDGGQTWTVIQAAVS